jgi:tetrahydromethanopterin S-methyltransferase subunit E
MNPTWRVNSCNRIANKLTSISFTQIILFFDIFLPFFFIFVPCQSGQWSRIVIFFARICLLFLIAKFFGSILLTLPATAMEEKADSALRNASSSI